MTATQNNIAVPAMGMSVDATRMQGGFEMPGPAAALFDFIDSMAPAPNAPEAPSAKFDAIPSYAPSSAPTLKM